MRTGIKRELAWISAAGAAALYLRGNKKRGVQLGFLSANLFLASHASAESFEGKVVVITGGSRGLGFALADRFLSEGAKVAILARDPEELRRAEARLKFHHTSDSDSEVSILPLVCDVTDGKAVKAAFQSIHAQWNRFDVVVNNAGMITVGPFETMERKDFEASTELHLMAVVETVQAALPYFHQAGRGQVINICSVGGLVPVPHMAAYDASKFALSGLSQAITAELADQNISVTTVYPTVMRTGSPPKAYFKGDAEKEFAWFETFDHLPGFSIEASLAAKKIVKAARNQDRVLILSSLARLRLIASALVPELLSFVMEASEALLPTGKSKELRRGSESRGFFEHLKASKLLRSRIREAELKYNQLPEVEKVRH